VAAVAEVVVVAGEVTSHQLPTGNIHNKQGNSRASATGVEETILVVAAQPVEFSVTAVKAGGILQQCAADETFKR
jgi:hypothetical protein